MDLSIRCDPSCLSRWTWFAPSSELADIFSHVHVRSQAVDGNNRLLVKSLLMMITHRYSVNEGLGCLDHLEQIGSGDLSAPLINLARISNYPCIRALSIHALFSWIQRSPRSVERLIELGMIPMLLLALESFPSSESPSKDKDIGTYRVSGAVHILLHLINEYSNISSRDLDALLEEMERHNATGRLLELCCTLVGEESAATLCMVLDLLKKITKLSPRLFESAMTQEGPLKLTKLLKIHCNNQSIMKYATLILARWAAIPGTVDRLEYDGVFEGLWDVITRIDAYDSNIYAYATCGICVLSIDRPEKLCSLLVKDGSINVFAFCTAIQHYDGCFQKHSVVHQTISQIVSSKYGGRILSLAAKAGLLESLTTWDQNCKLILNAIGLLISAQNDLNADIDYAKMAAFLVKKMPYFPEETVRILFAHDSQNRCLAAKLVERSFQQLILLEETNNEPIPSEDNQRCNHVSQCSDILISEPSSDSLAMLVEDHDTKETHATWRSENMSIDTTLGSACFAAFGCKNHIMGYTVILCKVVGKLISKIQETKSPGENEGQPAPKKCKTSITSSQRIHDMVRFQIGNTYLSICRGNIMEKSHVVSLFLEEDECDVEIPLLHTLSNPEETVCAFTRIFEWCDHGLISDISSMSFEDIKNCWIAADYLGMSTEFTDYILGESVESRLCSFTAEGRAHLFKWLLSLCTMFAGSEPLLNCVAKCMVYELGQCQMSLDGIANLECLQEFAQLDGISSAVTRHLGTGLLILA